LKDAWVESLHPDDADRCRAASRAAVQGHASCALEYRLRQADGTYRWVLDTGTPRFLPDGTFTGHIHSAIAITERKEAEEKVREQAALLDQANDAILVQDQADRILYWNRGAERLYGWSAREAVGRKAGSLLREQGDDRLGQAHRDLIARGEWAGELRQVTR